MSAPGTVGALRVLWANKAVRQAQLALAGSTVGDWSYNVAISVLVYNRAGAAWVGIAQVCRLVPAALAAPFLASLVDRYPTRRVLFATDALRAAIMAVICAGAAFGAPLLGLLALVVVAELVSTVFWPAQGAMLPTLVRGPEELAIANVGVTTVESTGFIIGPALGAAALAVFGTTPAFVVPIIAYVLSALAVTRIRPLVEPPAEEAGDEAAGHGALAGLAAIVRNRDIGTLVGLYAAQVFVAGALNVLAVVAALDVLDAGNGGLGALLVAEGIGSVLGAVPALALARRAGLPAVLALGLLLWGVPIALIGLVTNLPVALAMMALVGVGNTLVDASAITLMQHATPRELLGRVFGALESVVIAARAIGAGATPVLFALVGIRGTFIIVGAVLPLVTLPVWRRLRRIDARPVLEAQRVHPTGPLT